jgi:hypothetical protein
VFASQVRIGSQTLVRLSPALLPSGNALGLWRLGFLVAKRSFAHAIISAP